MPSYLDLGVIAVVLISGILAMMRGFTREILAIGSWIAAAAAAYFLYPRVTPFLSPYIHKENIAQMAAAAAVFLVSLIVVSLVTVRVSDAILDSSIGALDRSLGFLFGAARGFLLAVFAFFLFNWMVNDPQQQPEWVRVAKTRPALQETANRIVELLPEDTAQKLSTWIRSKSAVTDELENMAPGLAATPAATTAAVPAPAPLPAASLTSEAEKAKLDQMINKTVPAPAPAAPAIVPTPKKS